MATSVLVVEDDQQLRSAVVRDLAHRGFDVVSVSSFAGAIERIQKTTFDVVLTDLRMDERDGIDLLTELNRCSPDTRPILMSAFATARDHQRAVELGAIQVLCKPFSSEELLTAIQQAVECERGFHGSVHGLSLVDMLQMYHYARRDVTVVVGGVARGNVHLKNGEVIHAELGEETGEAALRKILSMASGSIHTSPLVCDTESISRSFQSLVLDVLREIDEDARSSAPDDGADPFDFRDFGEVSTSPSPDLPSLRPPSVPPPLQRVEEACRALVAALEGALCCAVVDLEHGRFLGSYDSTGFTGATGNLLAEATNLLFHSEALDRLGRILAGRATESVPFDEFRIASAGTYHFARALDRGRAAVILVTARTTNPGLGLAQLKATLPLLERSLT